MTQIAVEKCDHDTLYFGSGDYYVFCAGCGARWGRLGATDRPEYGESADGVEVGCDPQSANLGPSLGNFDIRKKPN